MVFIVSNLLYLLSLLLSPLLYPSEYVGYLRCLCCLCSEIGRLTYLSDQHTVNYSKKTGFFKEQIAVSVHIFTG